MLTLPPDARTDQAERAAKFMEAMPGCTLPELAQGADLGSASKVVSEMRRRFGYQLRIVRDLVATRDGRHSRRVARYWLIARPVVSQIDLFPE